MQLTSSFSEFVTRTAPYFLMTPRQVDGKYGLSPVVPVDSDEQILSGVGQHLFEDDHHG